MTSDWFSARRFMVTGGAGFLGSRIVGELRARGAAEVFVPRSATYDLRSPDACQAALSDANADVVIHAAASVGGIGANQDRPGQFFYDNITMGVNMIEQARRAGVEKFVTIGTVCSYPKHTAVPFEESSLWDGYPEETNAPYGIAKKALLVQQQAYRDQYGFRGIFLMPTNLYGPGDNFDPASSHVIPALIRKFIEARESNNASVEVWGTGSASREFLHVDDAARGIVQGAELYEGDEPLNLGAAHEITIRELAELLRELTGFAGEIVWDTSKPNGQPRRSLSGARAREAFGFEPSVRLRDGLNETIQWYLEARPDAAAQSGVERDQMRRAQ